MGLGGQVVAGVGGTQAAAKSPSQGQSLGRCKTSRRAELARWAGTAISCRRMVAVVALAWTVPAARVRLNAIAANTSQALFAANEGRWARAPDFRSAMVNAVNGTSATCASEMNRCSYEKLGSSGCPSVRTNTTLDKPYSPCSEGCAPVTTRYRDQFRRGIEAQPIPAERIHGGQMGDSNLDQAARALADAESANRTLRAMLNDYRGRDVKGDSAVTLPVMLEVARAARKSGDLVCFFVASEALEMGVPPAVLDWMND